VDVVSESKFLGVRFGGLRGCGLWMFGDVQMRFSEGLLLSSADCWLVHFRLLAYKLAGVNCGLEVRLLEGRLFEVLGVL